MVAKDMQTMKAMRAMKAMKAKAKAMSVKVETTDSAVGHTKFWSDVSWVLQDLIHSDGWVKEVMKGTLKTAKAKNAKTAMKSKTAMKPMKAMKAMNAMKVK
jgi:hypothetical protein